MICARYGYRTDNTSAMLHQLSYTYSQTKFGGENQEILRALGRLAGWMFRDTARAGNQHIVSASRLLDDSYVFPAQDARTAHLGFQLAWLTTEGDRHARLAASVAAEGPLSHRQWIPRLSVTSQATALAKWQDRREGQNAQGEAAAIAQILYNELFRRWKLTEQAYRLMANGERR